MSKKTACFDAGPEVSDKELLEGRRIRGVASVGALVVVLPLRRRKRDFTRRIFFFRSTATMMTTTTRITAITPAKTPSIVFV